MLQFEFVIYDENAELIRTEYRQFKSDSAARSCGGRLATKNGGPVDIARAGGGDWADRYMTTANPPLGGVIVTPWFERIA